MQAMGDNFYTSILNRASLNNGTRRLDQHLAEEFSRQCFPVSPTVGTFPLYVTFPQQIGVAQYDLEEFPSRQTAGKAFAVETSVGQVRCGVLKVVAFESPIVGVFEGLPEPDLLEVWCQDTLIGSVRKVTKGVFNLSTSKGDARIHRSDDVLFIVDGDNAFEFCMQSAREETGLPKGRLGRTSKTRLVFDPKMDFCDARAAMVFVLTMRMIYRSCDF